MASTTTCCSNTTSDVRRLSGASFGKSTQAVHSARTSEAGGPRGAFREKACWRTRSEPAKSRDVTAEMELIGLKLATKTMIVVQNATFSSLRNSPRSLPDRHILVATKMIVKEKRQRFLGRLARANGISSSSLRVRSI